MSFTKSLVLNTNTVPKQVSHDDFWMRYFFARYLLEEKATQLENLISAPANDEDFNWDSDEEEKHETEVVAKAEPVQAVVQAETVLVPALQEGDGKVTEIETPIEPNTDKQQEASVLPDTQPVDVTDNLLDELLAPNHQPLSVTGKSSDGSVVIVQTPSKSSENNGEWEEDWE
jgi:BSD domain